jgi:glycosyltransferase 2 family protein
METKPSIKRAVILTAITAFVLYTGLTIFGDFTAVSNAFRNASIGLLFIGFSLILLSYGFRFLNWQLYLARLGYTQIPRFESLLIFLGGFSLSLTPGKIGELLRSHLLKKHFAIPVSRTSSIVLVDRLTDVIAILMIAAVGTLSSYGLPILLVISALIAGLLLTITFPPATAFLLRLATKISFLAKRETQITNLLGSAQTLLQFKSLLPIIGISLCAWALEGTAIYFVYRAVGAEVSFTTALFVYAFSQLVGAASLLPGGLGITEGTMTGLLILTSIPRGIAATATLIGRAITLWFSIILGAIALAIFTKSKSTP